MKFNQVVAQLNQQHAVEVEDIIIAPPAHDPYDRLKAELVSRLSTSHKQCIRQLLSHEELGDRKPSVPSAPQGPGTRCTGRLPTHHLDQLATTPRASNPWRPDRGQSGLNFPPRRENLRNHPAAHHGEYLGTNTRQRSGTVERIDELKCMMTSLWTPRVHSCSHSRHHRSRTPPASPSHHNLCWYHRRFGDRT